MMNSCRGYFHLKNGLFVNDDTQGHSVRYIRLNLDSATGVESIQNSKFIIHNYGTWYDLFGRKLNGKPTQKGMYIHDGKAVVIN